MLTPPRRSFLKLAMAAGLVPAMGSLARPALAAAEARAFAPQPGDWQGYETVTRVTLPAGQGPAQVWLPVPSLDTDYQRSLGDTVAGNASHAEIITDPASGAKYLQASFDGSAAPELALTSRFQTRNRTIDWSKPGNATEDTAVLQAALRPSGNKPLDGIVAETAAKITAGANSDLEKVRAIYAWIVANCHRNLDTAGCGTGDAVATLASAGGKCADLNGLFVALSRASGVPARDVFGIRVAPSAFGFKQLGAKNEVITGAQHCRAEVWIASHGWVAMDPADVLKVMRAESDAWIKDPNDPLVTQVNAALFGNWEGNWVGYNSAEDLALAGSDRRLPFLMYPQATVNGQALDELDAKTFGYEITAQAIPA
ncbi:transglutaminase-like domain-containing protein [Paracoccus lutimaris]|uniref:Transglutaminase-like putative cysteine protease n=1 Tax=Paracoccus lutimaris TaxID=1490030 RepID=A0A368YLJ6_9RHOB|nr:transglutaminase domain-containing protein [Paracoccus lutimaris]RCW80469.1 transglutaminase-like putative cysteine protease [Paracoccus lutimaris]